MNQEFTIDENSNPGTVIGQVTAIDEDGHSITYSITGGNTDDAFEISGLDGELKVLNENAIDFEVNPVFKLTVEARDSKNKASAATITININDISPPTSGLILYLPFDGDLYDKSGHNNNAINYSSNNFVSGKWNKK